ncbi:MAG: hypothetical protein JSR46_00020 [Verrucomicrobia bacterium]|nr:hypothetical protein [Verrucomicrobiota bacterium]
MQITPRYFLTNETDIDTPDEQIFFNKLNEINQLIEAVEKNINEIAASIYSFAAPSKRILERHEELKTELAAPIETLTTCNLDMCKLYEQLPFLPLQALCPSMQQLFPLSLKLQMIKTKVEQLALLLNSPAYSQAVILYKVSVLEYDKLAKKGRVTDTFKATLKEQKLLLHTLEDPHLKENIKRIHEQMEQCDQEEKLAKEHINNELVISKLDEIKSTEERNYTRQDALPDITTKRKQRATDSNASLREDLAFRTGTGASVTEYFIINWGNELTAPLINYMKKLAMDLQILDEDVQDCLQGLYENRGKEFAEITQNEDLFRAYFEGPLSIIEKALEDIRAAFYQIMHSQQTSTGLNYAARLSAFIQDIRFNLSHIFANISTANEKTIASIRHTCDFLSIPHNSINTSKKIQALFSAAHSVSQALLLYVEDDKQLLQFNHKITKSLETLLSRVGLQVITQCNRDEEIWLAIVQGNRKKSIERLSESLLLTRIIQYLTREITEWFYFSKNRSYLKLDMALYALSKNAQYMDHIHAVGKNTPSFLELYSAYQRQFGNDILSSLVSLFELIDVCESSRCHNLFIQCYSKSIVQLAKIEQQFPATIPKWEETSPILKMATDKLRKIEENPNLYACGSITAPTQVAMTKFTSGVQDPDTHTTVLLHLLSYALWGGGDKQREASNHLLDHFKTLPCQCFSLQASEPLNCLIVDFIVDRATRQADLCSYEQFVIQKTLEAYQRSLQYGIEFPKRNHEEFFKKLNNDTI